MRAIKKIAAILLSVIFALALCACANGNDKPTDKTDAGQEKELVWHCYTLKHAYENNWITKDDLLDIAYYYDRAKMWVDPTRFHNDEVDEWYEMGEWYEPKHKISEGLDKQTLAGMKRAYLEAAGVTNFEKHDIEDRCVHYFGEYNGCIAAAIIYLGGSQANWSDMVGGVLFNYPSGPFEIKIYVEECYE